jgi:hypothetical protein
LVACDPLLACVRLLACVPLVTCDPLVACAPWDALYPDRIFEKSRSDALLVDFCCLFDKDEIGAEIALPIMLKVLLLATWRLMGHDYPSGLGGRSFQLSLPWIEHPYLPTAMLLAGAGASAMAESAEFFGFLHSRRAFGLQQWRRYADQVLSNICTIPIWGISCGRETAMLQPNRKNAETIKVSRVRDRE